jgi:hypothetical protein
VCEVSPEGKEDVIQHLQISTGVCTLPCGKTPVPGLRQRGKGLKEAKLATTWNQPKNNPVPGLRRPEIVATRALLMRQTTGPVPGMRRSAVRARLCRGMRLDAAAGSATFDPFPLRRAPRCCSNMHGPVAVLVRGNRMEVLWGVRAMMGRTECGSSSCACGVEQARRGAWPAGVILI